MLIDKISHLGETYQIEPPLDTGVYTCESLGRLAALAYSGPAAPGYVVNEITTRMDALLARADGNREQVIVGINTMLAFTDYKIS